MWSEWMGDVGMASQAANYRSVSVYREDEHIAHETMNASSVSVPSERILQAIHLIRGQKVMLDADLAKLYGVETKVLNQAVRRNIDRFPEDFAFRLSDEEFADLRSQIVTSSQWGGRRYPPYAFTEQGVAMLSSVLRSPSAVNVNIEIMRAFVQLRRMLATHEDLSKSLEELEERYDQQFRIVFDVIRKLMTPEPRTPKIGFDATEEAAPL